MHERLKVDSVGYIFAAGSIGPIQIFLASSKTRDWYSRVRSDCSRSSKVKYVIWKALFDFLSVINNNLGLISPFLRYDNLSADKRFFSTPPSSVQLFNSKFEDVSLRLDCWNVAKSHHTGLINREIIFSGRSYRLATIYALQTTTERQTDDRHGTTGSTVGEKRCFFAPSCSSYCKPDCWAKQYQRLSQRERREDRISLKRDGDIVVSWPGIISCIGRLALSNLYRRQTQTYRSIDRQGYSRTCTLTSNRLSHQGHRS